jgi:hypothetical protein
VGKETIKPELDSYYKRKRIASVSESTIGRIIKDLKERNLIPDLRSKLSFYGKSGKFRVRTLRQDKGD